jgi:hypothetical protein
MQAMTEAESAWMSEVREVFGDRDAGLARFQERGQGELGSRLRDLYTAYVTARDKYAAS